MVESGERARIHELVSWAVAVELEELKSSGGYVWVQEILGEDDGYMPDLSRSQMDTTMDTMLEAYRLGNIVEDLLRKKQCVVILHDDITEPLPFVGYLLEAGAEMPILGIQYGFVRGLNSERLGQYVHWGLVGLYAYQRKSSDKPRMRMTDRQENEYVVCQKKGMDNWDIRIRHLSQNK